MDMFRFLRNFVLISSLFILLSSCGGGGGAAGGITSAGDGYINHTVYSPFKDVLSEESQGYHTGFYPSRKLQVSHAESLYSDFSFGYDSGSLEASAEPFCKIGGNYTIHIENNAKPGAGIYKAQRELYYCKTIADLISYMKMPSSWANSDLYLYCNDGNNINFNSINFDTLVNEVDIYKGCILKNLDLEEQNTIFFGLEVGHPIVDDNENYRGRSSLTQGLTDETAGGGASWSAGGEDFSFTVYTYKGNNDEDVILYYDEDSTFFIETNVPEGLNTNLLNIFSLPGDFGLSRVAIFKSTSTRKVYGYETPIRLHYIANDLTTKPLYKVLYNGYPMNQDSCLNQLSAYSPVSGSPSISAGVGCSNNKIFINSQNVDAVHGENAGYNVFKNLVLEVLDV